MNVEPDPGAPAPNKEVPLPPRLKSAWLPGALSTKLYFINIISIFFKAQQHDFYKAVEPWCRYLTYNKKISMI
jgi:hypothetical protein